MCLACSATLNPQKADAFAESLLGIINQGALSLMISIGHRTGLFDTLATAAAPLTSTQLAHQARLNERYVREWLGAMVAGDIVEHDAEALTYTLPPEHANVLSRHNPSDNMAIFTQYVSVLGSVEDRIVDCFRQGGGVDYAEFNRFQEVMAEDSGQSILPVVIEKAIPLMPGMKERLELGIEVLDVGCGRGRVLNRLAGAFPCSRFTGFDLDLAALREGRDEAARLANENVAFIGRDLVEMKEAGAFDLIFAFDAIHDQARPDLVLRNIHRALRPGGTFFMQDIDTSGSHAGDRDKPLAPLLYTISTMHCMTVSLARGGMGLGAAWGRPQARQMLTDAGFSSIEIHTFEHDIQNCYYVVTK
ncbi:MAG: class I SAM-dependent methyltransferase [Opitutales bacterium]